MFTPKSTDDRNGIAEKGPARRIPAPDRETIQQQNEYLRSLHQTSLGLIDKIDAHDLLQTVLERAAHLAGTRNGFVYLRDADADQMTMRVTMGFFEEQSGRQVEYGEGLGGRVWQTGKPLLVDDYQHWQYRIADAALDRLHSVVGIPLKFKKRVRGVIGLGHMSPERRFDGNDVHTLERFAALALLAIEKAELYSNARRELAERRKAEARIRQSERRYRNFLESSPDPIVVYDMKGVATYVNPAFEETFGRSRQELLGKKIDFVPAEAWPATRKALNSMLAGEMIHLFETQRLTHDGRKLDVQLSSCLYLDENGKPAGNIVTLRDISALKRAQRELQSYQNQLEELVQERTAELGDANRRLASEVEERKRAEKALLRRESELKSQSRHLEEVNTALRVLLKQRETDRDELQKNVLANVGELVTPYLEQLKGGPLGTQQKTLVNILESNLHNIVSPFIGRLSSRLEKLTPTEVQVANLVKTGRTNQEIADVLCISKNTVLFHRHNIRRKLGLTRTRKNLRTHLQAMEE